jgi:ATP-binding cassette, subfamily B, bacterial
MNHSGGGGNWSTLRSMSRDGAIASQKLAPGTVRRIGAFASPYRRLIALFLATVVLEALLVVAVPILFGRIINSVVAGDRNAVTRDALLVALIAVVSTVVGLVGRWYSSRIGEGLIYDMRSKVFAHVQRMPVAFFTRTQTGALISRLNNDVIGAQQAFTTTLSGAVSNLLTVVITVAVMIRYSWVITIASLLLLPVFLIPARHVGRRISAMTREAMGLNADMSTMMTERFNVSGALLAKLFGRPEEEDLSFSSKAARVRDIGVAIALQNRIFFSALTLVAALATALVYGVGGQLAISGAMTAGSLVTMGGLLGRLYGPLTALSTVRIDVMTALVSFERVFEVLDLPTMITEKPDAKPLPDGPLSIELDDVAFRYPSADEVSLASLESVNRLDPSRSADVLHGISFRAEPGDLIALVGPSGAGKSTITALAPRLYDVTGGSVRIGGVDVRDTTLSSLHDSVGVVTQDAHMFHDSIRANLLFARPEASENELVAACRSAQIWDLVSSLPDGLDTVVGDRGHRLSGGEKQRLAIARLLLKAPSVVVLDEATAHLDSESEAAVQRALAHALEGRTSLVIAHRLSTIRDADQILVVEAGRIVERGKHDELLAAGGLYADLYRTQFAPNAHHASASDEDEQAGGRDFEVPSEPVFPHAPH